MTRLALAKGACTNHAAMGRKLKNKIAGVFLISG
jgi:hypothetical protein